jgi:hypothetical protein
MKLSDFGLCKPLDCSNLPTLHENDFTAGKTLKDVLDMDGRLKTSTAPKRTQQEQLSLWQRNRRMLKMDFGT